MVAQHLAGGGQLDAPAMAFEETQVKPLLERTDGTAEARLRDREPVGRLGQVTDFANREENAQVAGRHLVRSRAAVLSRPSDAYTQRLIASIPCYEHGWLEKALAIQGT